MNDFSNIIIDSKFNGKITALDKVMNNTPPSVTWESRTIIDNLLGGSISKKSLIAIVGGTGDGKSLLLCHLASRFSEDKKVLYLSFENTTENDCDRFRVCAELYAQMKPNNIGYLNIFESEVGTGEIGKWQVGYLDRIIFEGQWDVVCIDAWQNSFDTIDQEKISTVGNELMTKLSNLMYKTNTPIFFTWQSTKSANGKNLSDMSMEDLSGSAGVGRYATEVFFLKREKDQIPGKSQASKSHRKIKLLKTRGSKNARWDDPIEDLEISGRFCVCPVVIEKV